MGVIVDENPNTSLLAFTGDELKAALARHCSISIHPVTYKCNRGDYNPCAVT